MKGTGARLHTRTFPISSTHLFRNFLHSLALVSLSIFLSQATVASDPTDRRYNYTPDHLSRPFSASIQVAGSWSDSIRFLYNRGPGKTNFLKEILTLIDPANIKKMKGFKNPGSTRITLMSYEVRSREILQAIAQLTEAGYNVRVVSDPSTFTFIKKPTDTQWKSWSTEQQNYFLSTYDSQRDQKITVEEIELANKKHTFSNMIWKKLQELKKSYGDQLELITPPFELVPEDSRYPYPRLTHLKRYTVDFKKPDGSWATQVALISSANLTDTCIDKRVSGEKENLEAYINASEDIRYVRGSQGHIQFGAVLYGEKLNAPLSVVPDQWIELYKKGKHFDDMAVNPTFQPRVVFTDDKNQITSLQSFFSEGIKPPPPGVNHIDPIMAVTDILGRPDIQLKVMYSSQFVVTHPSLSMHLRHHLAHGGLEEFGFFVDGHFATEPYSSMPEMLFASKIDNRMGILPGRAIQTIQPLATDYDYLENTFVYEGDLGVVGEPGDKLHSKSSYYEYVDGAGVRHYLVVFGSANQSNNAGRQNADGLIVIDSTDASIGESIRPFFQSLKKDWRMRPYTEAFLERRLFEMFKHREDLFDKDYVKEWSAFMQNPPESNRTRKARLKRLVSVLKKLGPINDYGENFLKGLNWFAAQKNPAFNWENLQLLLFVSSPYNFPQPGFISDLKERWLLETASAAEKTKLTRLLNSMLKDKVAASATLKSRSPQYQACVEHLMKGYYKRLGISIPTAKERGNAF